MEYVVLDTNVLVDLFIKDQDVITTFLKQIKKNVFIPSVVYDEFFNDFQKVDKGYRKSKKIYNLDLEIKNIKKKLVEEYFEKIFKIINDIKKKYILDFDKLNVFIGKKNEKQHELLENIAKVKKICYLHDDEELYTFFYEVTDLINEIDDKLKLLGREYNFNSIRNEIKESITLFEELRHKAIKNKNIDKLYINYFKIKTFINSNKNDNYKLYEEEKSSIINYLENNPNLNYWGKKDIENGKKNGYNDQFIWKEVIKFSKERQVSIILLTNDKKDFKDCNLKKQMMKEFYEITGQEIKIQNLHEYGIVGEIEKQELLKDNLELFLQNEFTKYNEVDDVINEAINFIEKNCDEVSEFIRNNSEWLDELFDDDYEYGEEFILATNILMAKLGDCYEFDDEVNLKCKFIEKVNDEKAILKINVTLDVGEQLECIIKYNVCLIIGEEIKFNIEDVEFDISGEKYFVNSCEEVEKVMIQKYCFIDYIEPIIEKYMNQN